ncbi:3-oxoacyl-[acyl-carrier-protein] reductase FabG [Fulvia fulva]|uniref:3-oxoacyl-[acyl-carrier-protein] reductase FabG n=1 Tax=Passalora fulva TaxID=5499 RepID=A0A9Q8UW35_PASFU|nr:3-oxoacyl-[acyl-carrier-protein] reductase FabG [Fulvia fulva]KAK4610490.1 3-oxoacyl-[acyl-carrier-protein] reductase FabG [Fulvia fulva]KAK4611014.1 3-oxoacyl-[acyl-carrier-protein] reductase FabG [Fulvia fulva]UJO24624.1 3-oxoacyl-[acyl-carrier-protein] reductase FabG [Fulvia fulva]WPV21907.1 3-oxoacyl-[acyl-carrier-protein] reductase FabG [Fulvia fulva]WPV36957.1 3-oxoacyl-[acyl-carrier-protein] reductase FabG [Fulvia fulva]
MLKILEMYMRSCQVCGPCELSSAPSPSTIHQLLKMPYALAGRNVLITGGSRGLGAEIARKFAAERCNVAINYANNEQPAQDLAKELQSDHNVKTTVVKGDGGMVSDIKNCIKTTIDAFGGLDIIIGNAGFTKFSNFKDLDAMSYEEWDKCWNTNVKGNHALLKEALPTLNANPDGGVFILTSSVAGKSLSGSSMAYSVTKAAQIHLMKCLAHTQGPKIRVNAVLPGLLLTDWGNLYGDDRINGLKNVAALKKETELGDCAQMFVDIARNTSMTGQAVHVDSGLVPFV